MTRARPIILAAALLCLQGCATFKQALRYARSTDPLTAQEHLTLGVSYERQSLHKEAEKEYRAAIQKDKKDLAPYLALGNLLYAQKRLPEAGKAFRRALRLDPANPAAKNNLAMVYLALDKKRDRAVALAKEAGADPRFRPYALDTLARASAAEGRYDEANAYLDEALKIAPAGDPTFREQIEKTRKDIIDSKLTSEPSLEHEKK